MDLKLLVLWAITGGGLSAVIMMIIWLPDPPPPPEILGRFVGIAVSGILGGLVGGFLTRALLEGSDPMPGIVVAAAVGLLFSASASIFSGGRGRAVH